MIAAPISQKRKIFIVDDHPMVREWLTQLFNLQSDLQVCGEAASVTEGLKLIVDAQPNVAIVDISMKGGSGLEFIKEIKTLCPEVAVIVLSVHDKLVYGKRAFRAGAQGYVVKEEAAENVIKAVRRVLEGKFYLSEKIASSMAERYAGGKPPVSGSLIEALSDRELEVFQFIGAGCGTRQIAEEMKISFKTVQSFCARIKEKLRLTSATELLREAVRWHDGLNLK